MTEPSWDELAEMARSRGDYASERRFADAARAQRHMEPESWAGYDKALAATMTELELHPFTDWAHSHLLFPYIKGIVAKHFPDVGEAGQAMVAAGLTGGMVAARRGGTDDEIAQAFKSDVAQAYTQGVRDLNAKGQQ